MKKAYLLVRNDVQPDGSVVFVDIGIYSEPHPTCKLSNILSVLYETSGETYEEAYYQMATLIESDRIISKHRLVKKP